jgi:Uma2 family endonuclease
MRPATSTVPYETMADTLERLGNISPGRVVMKPAPGKATEKDLLRLHRRTDRLFELIDGTLVEKVMGFGEGFLAIDIARLLGRFLDENDLGDLGGADATMRIMPGMVRIPDLSFIRWEKLPNRQRPTEPIPDLVPDLAIEVVSEGNTPGEMKLKLKAYFLAGVSLVWLIDPRTWTVEVFTAPDQGTTLTEDQTLEGGTVLPGLRLPVRALFARVPRSKGKQRKKRQAKGEGAA